MIPSPNQNILTRNLAFLLAALLTLSFLQTFTGLKHFSKPTSTGFSDKNGSKEKLLKAYGSLPLYFIPNKGQLDKRVLYYSQGSGYNFYLTKEGVTYSFVKKESSKGKTPSVLERKESLTEPKKQGFALKVKFLGANKETYIQGQEEQEGKVNYFIGNDPKKWHPDLATFREVTYKNLYKGIDLTYKGDQKRIKYEFVVAPGASYKTIKLLYQGADYLKLDKKGNLLVGTPFGTLKDVKPYIYQVIGGKKKEVNGHYALKGDYVGFSIGKYDPNYPLVIDPALIYSTFLGQDWGNSIVLDSSGNAYLTGVTSGTNFPTTSGVFDSSYNSGYDVFVTKINSTGNDLIYSTFLGGTGSDWGYDIALDSAGSTYITGRTDSSNFPMTMGAYDTSYNGGGQWPFDVFVTKLNPTGSDVVYSTFLGGSSLDRAFSIAIDSSDNAYVTGMARSSDFPTTPGAYDPSYNGGDDAFVSKLNASGTALLYSTFLGGSSQDFGNGIAVDASESAYIVGKGGSNDFPTTLGAYDNSHNGADDVFVSKLNSTGSALHYSTFLGGNNTDHGEGIRIDSSGNAYVTGETWSSSFPTSAGAYDTSLSSGPDAFVTKLDPSGSALAYSTLLGGSSAEYSYQIALDGSGNTYLTGETWSSDFPVTFGAYEYTYNNVYGPDVFVTKLDASGNALIYSTFLGGTNSDFGYGLSLDSSGNAYATGGTLSSDFPTTPGAYDPSYNGGQSIFVAKLDFTAITPPPPSPPATPAGLTTKVGDMKNVLSWNPVASATYNVYRSTSLLGPFYLVTSSPIAATSFIDTPGLKDIYYYRVTSVVNTVESAQSTTVQADFVDMEEQVSPPGDTLDALNGEVTLEIPSSALSTDTNISVVQQTSYPSPSPGLYAKSRIFDFGPSGTNFSNPVTITLKYNQNVDPDTLDVYWYDTSATSWTKITAGRIADTVNKTISVETTHFTLFGVFSTAPSVVPPSSPSPVGLNTYWITLLGLTLIITGFLLIREINV